MRCTAGRRDPPSSQDPDAAGQVPHPRIGVGPEPLQCGKMTNPPPNGPMSQDRERSYFDPEVRVIEKRGEELGPIVSTELECGCHRLAKCGSWTACCTVEDRQGSAKLHVPAQQDGPNRERQLGAGIRGRGVREQRLSVSVRRCVGVDGTDRTGEECDDLDLRPGKVEVERGLGIESELEVCDLKGAGHVTTPRHRRRQRVSGNAPPIDHFFCVTPRHPPS